MNETIFQAKPTVREIIREEFWVVAKAFFAPIYGAIIVLRQLRRATREIDRSTADLTECDLVESISLMPAPQTSSWQRLPEGYSADCLTITYAFDRRSQYVIRLGSASFERPEIQLAEDVQEQTSCLKTPEFQ